MMTKTRHMIIAFCLFVGGVAYTAEEEPERAQTQEMELEGEIKDEKSERIHRRVERMDQRSPEFSGTMTAWLVQPEENAKENKAVVRVDVKGVELVDPTTDQPESTDLGAHLTYQLDGGEVKATDDTSVTFENLSPGVHVLEVTLVDKQNREIVPTQVMRIGIPEELGGKEE